MENFSSDFHKQKEQNIVTRNSSRKQILRVILLYHKDTVNVLHLMIYSFKQLWQSILHT